MASQLELKPRALPLPLLSLKFFKFFHTMEHWPLKYTSFCSSADLDKFAAEDIIDPIAKAKMVALKGIKKVMAQGSIGVAPGMNR